MKVDFSIKKLSVLVSGYYTNHEKIELLKVSSIEQIDIAFPFLAAMIDQFCVIDNADTMVTSIRYFDIVRAIFQVYSSAR